MCGDCGCDILEVANNNLVPGFVAAVQFVEHVAGKHVFICWHCTGERYKVRQVRVC